MQDGGANIITRESERANDNNNKKWNIKYRSDMNGNYSNGNGNGKKTDGNAKDSYFQVNRNKMQRNK